MFISLIVIGATILQMALSSEALIDYFLVDRGSTYQLVAAALAAIIFGWLARKKEHQGPGGRAGIVVGITTLTIITTLVVLIFGVAIWIFFTFGFG